MPSIQNNSLEIYYQRWGDPSAPALLLIHGLTCQIIHWPEAFISALTSGGYQVIAFDNRDVGLSSKLDDMATPTLEAIKRGETFTAPYNLADMATDGLAILDHLHISQAHILGLSMGGMIGQRLAIDHPERVLSLTSIMSTTGDPSLPGAQPEAWSAFISMPPDDHSQAIAHNQNAWNTVAGPNYVSTKSGLGRQAAAAYERGFSRSGFVRQILAIISGGNRKAELASVAVPVLAIHGDCDPLVPIEGGADTANAVSNGKLFTVAGMGHDLPDALLPEIIQAILQHLDSQ